MTEQKRISMVMSEEDARTASRALHELRGFFDANWSDEEIKAECKRITDLAIADRVERYKKAMATPISSPWGDLWRDRYYTVVLNEQVRSGSTWHPVWETKTRTRKHLRVVKRDGPYRALADANDIPGEMRTRFVYDTGREVSAGDSDIISVTEETDGA